MHKLRTLPLAVPSCYATRRSDALQYIEKPCTHCVLHMYFPLKKQVLCTVCMVFHGSSKSSNSSSEEVPKEPPFWSSFPWSLSSRVVVRECPVRHVRWGPRRPWRTTAEDDSGGVSVPAPSRTRHPPTRSAGRVWLHNGLRGKQS